MMRARELESDSGRVRVGSCWPCLLAALIASCTSSPTVGGDDPSTSGGMDTTGASGMSESSGGDTTTASGAGTNGGSDVGTGPSPNGADGETTDEFLIGDDDEDDGRDEQSDDDTATDEVDPDADTTSVPAPPMFPDHIFVYDRPMMDAGACASVKASGTLESRPVDIIVSVDNSSSMNSEIQAIEDRINDDLALIIEASGIDYRIILVSRYGYVNEELAGSDNPICIGPPLGNADCDAADHPMLVNTERFYHHSTDIESRNMWCRLLESYDAADEIETDARDDGDPHFPWQPVAACAADEVDCLPGWQRWLRPDSFKIFVGITDDAPGGNGCDEYGDSLEGATAWDQALRTRSASSEANFGAFSDMDPDANRNYAWYSIVGMQQTDLDGGGVSNVPLTPADPIVTETCEYQPPGGENNLGERAGEGYQHLSVLTGGLRYPSCLVDDFDAVFNAIAEGVIERSEIQCDFPIPEPEDGSINFENIEVEYQPTVGDPVPILRVDGAADCADDAQYYFDDNAAPTTIQLCPDTCTRVQSDETPRIGIDLGCLGI